MKNKGVKILGIIVVILLLIIVEMPKLFLNKKDNILPEVKLKEINKNKTFAIMVSNDTKDGYKAYNGNKWPTSEDDYYYNHAECVDNKGNIVNDAIKYNEEENKATLTSNSTVYCTLYFDKYNYMKVPLHKVAYLDNKTIDAPLYMSAKVKKVEFVDNLPNLSELEKDKTYWDLSDTEHGTAMGSVIAWIEPIQNDESHDTLYIGSKTKIRVLDLSYSFTASEYDNSIDESKTNLEGVNFNNMLDTSKTTTMYRMFMWCSNLIQLNGLENWNIINLTNMRSMFYGCNLLNDFDFLENWNVLNVENMGYTFFRCENLTNLNFLSKWKLENVTYMDYLFSRCTNLADIILLNNWNVSKVTNMANMFAGCSNLINVNLSSWNTKNVTNVSNIFRSCTNLKIIDLSNATFTQITDSANYQNMFYGVQTSATITVKADQESWIQNTAKFPGTVQTV